MRRSLICLAVTLVASLTLGRPAPVQAADWTFQITPYAWMTGLEGSVGAPPVDVDLSFSDVLEDLEASGMVLASARNGPWAVFADFTHSNLSSSLVPLDPSLREAIVDAKTTTFSLALGYQLYDRDQLSLDGYLGLRSWWLDNALTLVDINGQAARFPDDHNWVNPLVGLNVMWTPAEDWTLFSALEGGGALGGSDYEWSAFVGASYAFNHWVAASAGWRHLDVTYSDGDFVFDVVQSGPVLGVTFKF